MATAPSPPILIWQPGGGFPGGPVSNPPVYSQAGITQLVNGQSYIDVVFGSTQTTPDWVLVECEVVNTTDVAPLNIWPGIITSKLTTGFRLYLNGMPDSGNYYLHWAVSGVNITPTPASTYYLTGPVSGAISVPVTFTVALPPNTTVPGAITVTPSDGGGGGVFSPVTVTLTNSSASATFTYTPGSYGAKTISVTNSGTLTDPASIAFTAVAATYTLSGPSSGATGVPSTNFTVALPVGGVVIGTVTVTPGAGGGGGTFTPTSVNLTTAAPSATFTYTPTTDGTKTISVTNNGGLTNPGNISYVASSVFDPTTIAGLKLWLKADAGTSLLRERFGEEVVTPALADGDPLTLWTDQSGNGNNFSAATSANRPIYKTNRINGLPALKFDGVDDRLSMVNPLTGLITTAVSVFIVQRKNANSATLALLSEPTNATNSFAIYLPFSDNNIYFDLGDSTGVGRATAAWGGNYTNFFVWSFIAGGGNMAIYRNGTTVVSNGSKTNSFTPTGLTLTLNGATGGSVQDADIAEILIYNSSLGTTDRVNVETYLRTKYNL